ncbi:MoxR family ATPase [Ketobacter sp. MCCC 1A13808]|uniref:AAA family ATPase n=1 Tax=Ketobacter sp. MCCC 1A13808 TaxID=2602738 RepID=UPI0013296531|nr:MoxR family ATPase [Ketobacter sp. MCCC 1A13808]MVF12455.1 MoxR family ATPase [Ketobacter sp. MCCC 1A13808]
MSQSVPLLIAALGNVLLGKEEQVKLALACLLAKGHLLVEDLPGMGKTTLSYALARVMGLQYQRVQFTSDLLPADIIGTSIFNQSTADFEFRPGPVFSEVLLADEINRATPKTQGALLESMEERQVTIDGHTYPLPSPFFVIATQNPATQAGTFPLPESQLDRFLMCISLGYPDPEVERKLLKGYNPRQDMATLKPAITKEELAHLQQQCQKVFVSDALLDYVQRVLAYSRESNHFNFGLSPRAGMAIIQSAKSYAFVCGREHVIPEDVQAVLPSVAEHRLAGSQDITGHEGIRLVDELLKHVDVLAIP